MNPTAKKLPYLILFGPGFLLFKGPGGGGL